MRNKVLLVTSGGVTGSLAHYAYSIISRLKSEFDFHVLSDGKVFTDAQSYQDAVEADRDPDFRVPTAGIIAKVARYLTSQDQNYEVVHFLTQRYFLFAHERKRHLLGVADIFPFGLESLAPEIFHSEHQGLPYLLRNTALSVAVRRAKRRGLQICVHTEFNRRELERVFSYSPLLVHRLPYLLDPRIVRGERAASRRLLGIPSEVKVVLSIGSGLPRKNLSAFYFLVNNSPSEAQFIKIGDADLSKVEPSRRSWVKHIPWVSSVDLATYYSATDALFFPSYAEGFGVPLLESMTCGVPIVCSDIATNREVAGGAALFASPRDYSGLTGQTWALLSSPEIKRRLLAASETQLHALDQKAAATGLADLYHLMGA